MALIIFYTLDIKNIIFNPKFYQHFLPSLVITYQFTSIQGSHYPPYGMEIHKNFENRMFKELNSEHVIKISHRCEHATLLPLGAFRRARGVRRTGGGIEEGRRGLWVRADAICSAEHQLRSSSSGRAGSDAGTTTTGTACAGCAAGSSRARPRRSGPAARAHECARRHLHMTVQTTEQESIKVVCGRGPNEHNSC